MISVAKIAVGFAQGRLGRNHRISNGEQHGFHFGGIKGRSGHGSVWFCGSDHGPSRGTCKPQLAALPRTLSPLTKPIPGSTMERLAAT